MKVWRASLWTAGGAALLTACASSGGSDERTDGAALRASSLAVCTGGRVANAPAADGNGRVRGFTPLVGVRGVELARAPTRGCLSSGFGLTRGRGRRYHEGIDISTGRPRDVGAGAKGRVSFVGWRTGYGNTVEIDHGQGVKTRYGHLSRAGVAEGRRVSAGEIIGRTGKTGNATGVHLHYEILADGRPVNPLQ